MSLVDRRELVFIEHLLCRVCVRYFTWAPYFQAVFWVWAMESNGHVGFCMPPLPPPTLKVSLVILPL